MSKESVIIEPQIVNLGKDGTYMLKITNKSSEYLDNFFFCLYNQEKFEFSPDSFSLAPNQQKLIKLRLKIKTLRSVSKEFAYLKTAQTNNRITILINHQQPESIRSLQSPEPRISTQEQGLDEAYTLSSRDYRQSQTLAFNKIIEQKEQYITRLQQQIQERDYSESRHTTPKDQSRLDISLQQLKELENAEVRVISLQKENENLLRENLLIHRRFEQYKDLCEGERKDQQRTEIFSEHIELKDQEIQRLYLRIRSLEEEGGDFLRQLGEKETLGKQLERKVRELQDVNLRVTQEIKADNEHRIFTLEKKFQEQRESYQNSFRSYQSKIRELEVLASNQVSREQLYEMESQVSRLTRIFKEEKELRRQCEIKLRTETDLFQSEQIKLQLMTNQLSDRNGQVLKKNRELEHIIEKMHVRSAQKNQNQQVSEREISYIQIALDSCKNENELLRSNYSQLEKIYKRYQESSSSRMVDLESENSNLQKNIRTLQGDLAHSKDEKEIIQEESHNQLMKVKKENVELLEKIAIGNGLGRKGSIELLKQELNRKQEELIEFKLNQRSNDDRMEDLRHQNRTLHGKVSKYKKEARSQLKSINNSAIQQLKRVHDQKKQLAKRCHQLEQRIQQSDCDKNRHKSRTGINLEGRNMATTADNFSRGNQSHQQAGRKVGIKDQRRQLQESRANSNNQTPDQQENIYQELGELRELDNYIRNQQERFCRMFTLNGDYSVQENGRSIFRAIKFFKELQRKVKDIREEAEQSSEAVNELHFMRGRLAELQTLKKQTNQSINLKEKSSFMNAEIMEFIRVEMKSQYKKLHDALKLVDEKHGLLKKKIYQEYRSRIISQLEKKDKNVTVHQIQATLERFIQGLSNLSHKEAVLAKEIRLKQASRKQAAVLREKLREMSLLLETKKGYCSRDPVRIWVPESEFDWQENLKLQAQLLSHDAQLHRIREELDITKDSLAMAKDQLKKGIQDLDESENDNLILKRQIIDAESLFQKEINNIAKKNEDLIRNGTNSTKEKNKDKETDNKRQITKLQRDLETKQEVIKSLKDKERMYEEMVEESNRSDSREIVSKRRLSQENRMRDNIKELGGVNRQLRKENNELNNRVKLCEDEIAKKNTYINSIKGDNEEHRIRTLKKDENQNQKLRNSNRQLNDLVKKLREDIDKVRKAKDLEIGKLIDEAKRLRNESKINQKSYESIIRGLLDTLRKIYSALDICMKRKGRKMPIIPDFQTMSQHPIDIDALRVYKFFEQPLNMLQAD